MSAAVSLALGGSDVEGLVGWGVVRRLLEDESIDLAAVSASGTGAFTAVALARGLSEGGRSEAIAQLDALWSGILDVWRASVSDPEPWQLLMPLLATSRLADATVTGDPVFCAPQDVNPLDLNPVLAASEVFLPEPGQETIPIFLSAVNVNTGSKRIFTRDELSRDTLRAATCVPLRNAAVAIDGDFYWGADVSSPALFPLFAPDLPGDIFCSILRVSGARQAPSTGEAIGARMAALTSNSGLQAELRSVEFVQRLIDAGFMTDAVIDVPWLHGTIVAPPGRRWPDKSALNTDSARAISLFELGYDAAGQWLETSKDLLGQANSLDIRSLL